MNTGPCNAFSPKIGFTSNVHMISIFIVNVNMVSVDYYAVHQFNDLYF